MKSLVTKYTLGFAAVALAIAPFATHAQSEEEVGALFGLLFFGGFAFFWLVFAGIMIAGTVFWIWMLIDLLQRDNFKGDNEKILWAVILLFVSHIGALIYYLAVKRPADKEKKMAQAPAMDNQTPPTPPASQS